MNSFPNCIVIPSANGSLSNCITMKMPSLSAIIIMIIVSWALMLLIAYLIHYYLNKVYPSQKISYWIILGILLLSMIIFSLLSTALLS